ncbi:hypothetical protein C8R43DRAFT_1121079 [Mycena crocata]|nr:hypothetical protein C8R43DRAFT_1121079 [Mycena crocata]
MPPKSIDLSTLPALEQIKGAPLSALNKTDLLAIANALEIPLPVLSKDITVDNLKVQIGRALTTPEFAADTRFLKFTTYRPATTGAAHIKNSADKSVQDANAAVQDSNVAPTGFSNTSQGESGGGPTPKFKILSSNGGGGGKVESGPITKEGSESSLTSADYNELIHRDKPTSAAPVNSPAINTGTAEDQALSDLTIIANFIGSETREVWVLPEHRKNIPLHTGPRGEYLSSLKKIIPAALAGFSSLRDIGNAKLTVTGITGNPLSLGTAAKFSKGNIPAVLMLTEADSCILYQKTSVLGVVAVLDIHVHRSAAPAAESKFEANKLTGDIKPLDLAKTRPRKSNRKSKKKANSDSEPNVDNDLLQFLNEILMGGTADYIGKTLTTAGAMLVRWSDLKGAIAFCDKEWSRKGKGRGATYRVPASYVEHANPGYHKFACREFNKADLEDTLIIGHTVANNDRAMFQSPLLPYNENTQRYIAGELKDGVTKTIFDNMAKKEWLAYLDDAKKAADRLLKRGKEQKKRRRTPTPPASASSEADEEEAHLRRKLKELEMKKHGQSKKTKKAKTVASNAEAGPSRTRGRSSLHLDSDSASG